MKHLALSLLVLFIVACAPTQQTMEATDTNTGVDNPLIQGFNEVIPFAELTAADIPEATDLAIEKAQVMLDAILAIEDDKRTFSNTIVAMDDI